MSAPASSPPSDTLGLTLAEHHAAFFATADRLRRARILTDVVLVGDDGGKFYAHRIVLTACSGYFARMFASGRGGPPKCEVALKGVSVAHIGRLLDYMYRGEIDVPEDDLVGLLETARTLRVNGLEDEAAKKRPRRSRGGQRRNRAPEVEFGLAQLKATPVMVKAKVKPSVSQPTYPSVSNAKPSVRTASRKVWGAVSKSKPAAARKEVLEETMETSSEAIPVVGVSAGSNPLDDDCHAVDPPEEARGADGDVGKDEEDYPMTLGCWRFEYQTRDREYYMKKHYLEQHQMAAMRKMNEEIQASQEQKGSGASCGEYGSIYLTNYV